MRWGRRWGNFWGDDALHVHTLRSKAIPAFVPTAVISWQTDLTNPLVLFVVYVNGKYYDFTTDTRMLVALDKPGVFAFEVFATTYGALGENAVLQQFLEDRATRRIRLHWSAGKRWGTFRWGEQAWGKCDAVLYRIYWDEGLGGGPSTFLAETDRLEYATDQLPDGTYEFRIDPVDAAGNQTTSAITHTVVIAEVPAPTLDFLVTAVDLGTNTFDAEWTESESADVTQYRIYSNGGSGEIDYSTVVATIAAPADSGSWVETVVNGRWRVAIRAFDGTGEEDNVHQIHEFDVFAGNLLGPRPATPYGLVVEPQAGGFMLARVQYLPSDGEEAVATHINLYYDNGLGTIQPGVLATVALPSHTLNEQRVLEVEMAVGPLTDGVTYLFTAAARVGARVGDPMQDLTSAVCDASGPCDLTAIHSELV